MKPTKSIAAEANVFEHKYIMQNFGTKSLSNLNAKDFQLNIKANL